MIEEKRINPGRVNTYRDVDFFKVIVLSPSLSTSEEKAKWLTNTPSLKSNPHGEYKCPFKNTLFVAYATSPNSDAKLNQATVGLDGAVIFLESADHISAIKAELDSFAIDGVRLLVSKNENASVWAKELKAELFVGKQSSMLINEHEEVLKKLDELDQKEYSTILHAIKRFDENNSGLLEISEMPKLVSALGGDINKAGMKEAILALDVNHDNILQVDEFIQWWKIGRQNSQALSKIYELNVKTTELVTGILNFNSFQKQVDTTVPTTEKLKENTVSVNVSSQEIEEYVTRVCFKIAMGAEKRKEATKNFLSRYTNIHETTDDNWINIAFFVQSLTFEGQHIKDYLENFRTNLITHAEKSLMPGLSNFIRDFVVFEFYPQDYSANIVFRFKSDVYALIRDALTEILVIRDWLTNNKQNSFEFDLKLFSDKDLGEFIKEGKSLAEFLNTSEITINSSGIKGRLKTLLTNLTEKYKYLVDYLQFLFVPNSMKLTYKGDMNEVLHSDSSDSLNFNLSKLGPIIEFIKSNVDKELLQCMSRIEIGLNLYDIFLNLQVFSETLWQ